MSEPIRTVRVTTGKSAAYGLAASIRAKGGMATTINVHGRVYEVRVYREGQP